MTNDVQAAGNAISSTVQIMTGWIQLGFAGLCLILLRAFVKQGKDHTSATVQNAVALNSNTEVTRELAGAVRSLSDKLVVPDRGMWVQPTKLHERSG